MLGCRNDAWRSLTAHFHGEKRMERRTDSPSTPPQGAFPKFSPEFPPWMSPGQEPQAFVSVCLGALHRLHPCRELSCVAPALLFLHVALPKEPRAPRQGDEVIYLCLDNALRYLSADQLTRFCSDVEGERSARSSLRGRTLSHRGIQIGHPFIHVKKVPGHCWQKHGVRLTGTRVSVVPGSLLLLQR